MDNKFRNVGSGFKCNSREYYPGTLLTRSILIVLNSFKKNHQSKKKKQIPSSISLRVFLCAALTIDVEKWTR